MPRVMAAAVAARAACNLLHLARRQAPLGLPIKLGATVHAQRMHMHSASAARA